MRLILIRHAESDASRRRIIAGQNSCTGLTPDGRLQARALASRLMADGELSSCQALLSSPLLRARQTAELLAPALSVSKVQEHEDLCELRPGQADGLTWPDYVETYGEFDLLDLPERPLSPEGESWNVFRRRVSGCLTTLDDRFQDETVIAVTHGGFIAASVIATFDIPRPGTGARLDPGYTSLTEWRVTDSTWQLARYNDTNHLT